MRPVEDDERIVGARETARKRDAVEVFRMRAHLLTGEDRAMLEMHLEHGNSFRQIGRLMGLDSRNVGRRIRRITRRLADGTYSICLSNRDDFNGHELALIKDYFVLGLSERGISRKRAVTLYRVKTTLRKARRYAASMKTRHAECGVRSRA
jgi:hypothetical protein